LLLCIVAASCSGDKGRDGQPATASAAGDEYVLLVPDFRNAVVHTITMSGEYKGDLLDPSRYDDPQVPEGAWREPKGLLYLDDPAPRLWLVGERMLSEWNMDGTYERAIYTDGAKLETPTGIARIGDRVYVISEDKKRMLVFDTAGEFIRTFGGPNFDRAKGLRVGPDGKLYVPMLMKGFESPGLVAIWDPETASPDNTPLAYKVPPETGEDGTWWACTLEFDADGKVLLADFTRSRVERWDLEKNAKLDVLLDAEGKGRYRRLKRGPDGLMYLAGPDGIYRFDSRAKAGDLKDLRPFFDAKAKIVRLKEEFSPSEIVFVPRSAIPAGLLGSLH
jgi:hypothetical protein